MAVNASCFSLMLATNKNRKNLCIASLALILSLSTAGKVTAETTAGGSTNPAAINYYKEGSARSAAGDHTGAIIALTQAITLDPKYYKAYANRSASRINVHDYKGALEDVNIALKCFPNEPKVLELKAIAERGLSAGNGSSNNSNNDSNNEQALAQERVAAARRAITQAMIGGDFSDPATMIMMQAQRNRLMNNNAGAARPMVNPFAPRVAPEGSSGKDNPFTVHNQPEISSASSSNNSPFEPSANTSSQNTNTKIMGSTSTSTPSSTAGSDSPFEEKKTASPNVSTVIDNLPLIGRFASNSPRGNPSQIRLAARQYYDLGCAKAESKKFSGAIEEFSQAISHDSSYGEAYANRGLAKFHSHDYQGALSDFEHADKLIANNDQLKSFIQAARHAVGN
jgi:tetratricopeptide (TPR) repeat protein